MDNLASKDGGGINLAEPEAYPWLIVPLQMPTAGRVEIVNSTLSGNAAGGGGAAINNAGSGTVYIESSRIVDNPGEMIVDPEYHPDPLDPDPDPPPMIPAPGVYEPDQSAIVNQAEFDVVGTIHIVDSLISGNIAKHDGAGVNNAGDGILTIEDSTITNNKTDGDGGGIYSDGGTLTIKDTTVSANTAHGGGGIYSGGASNGIGLRSRVEITNTRIAANDAEAINGNIAEASGGGLVLDGDAANVAHRRHRPWQQGRGRRRRIHHRRPVLPDRHPADGHQQRDPRRRAAARCSTASGRSSIRDSTFSGNKAGTPEPLAPGELPPIGEPGGPIFEGARQHRRRRRALYRGRPGRDLPARPSRRTSPPKRAAAISIDNFGAFTDQGHRRPRQQRRRQRRRHREQRHARHLRPPAGHRQQGHPRRRRRSTTPPATSSWSSARTSQRNVGHERRRLRQRPRRRPDHPRLDDLRQHRPACPASTTPGSASTAARAAASGARPTATP